MKTYIITEKDIKRLKNSLLVEDLLVDNWVETLKNIDNFIDKECFDNKYVWDDDDYLQTYYPEQYLIKQLISP